MGPIVMFEAIEELDKNEGRGGVRSLGFFEERADADAAAVGMGCMDGPGRVAERKVVRCDDGTYWVVNLPIDPSLVYTRAHVKLRARALAKLTPEERVALGLAR